MPPPITIDDIKSRLISIFGDKYEFDLSDYKNTHSKIGVRCLIHGWNKQIVKNLFKGSGCRMCIYKTIAKKQMSNIDDIIGKFNKAHGDRYDYSKFEYKGDRISSTIICPAHGEFQQIPNVHAKGHGCPSCSKNKRLTTDEFIKSASNRHPNYIYDFVNYKNMHSKVKIVCPSHGEFQQIPLHHLKGVGCPKCNQSKGEKLIESFLLSNGIKFNQPSYI